MYHIEKRNMHRILEETLKDFNIFYSGKISSWIGGNGFCQRLGHNLAEHGFYGIGESGMLYKGEFENFFEVFYSRAPVVAHVVFCKVE